MPFANYPRTVAEVVANVRYRRGVISAVRAFKRSKPYRGMRRPRVSKFRRLLTDLSRVYGIEIPSFEFRPCRLPTGRTGNGRCCRSSGERTRITLFGKLSVVTFLHEFAHALGHDERKACRWSINLFRRVFPVLASRCDARGHMLIARGGAR